MQAGARKTSREYWETQHTRRPRLRFPSSLSIPMRDSQRLLRAHVRPGDSVLEIGHAPGKHLAYVAKTLRAKVSGLDYSTGGVDFSQRLFETLGIDGDLRCEDVFDTTFADGSFDLVYSRGVIEHFDDPRPIVRIHAKLLKPGGVALMTVPNYGGIYGHLQKRFDPDNLALHNLEIMSREGLARLAPSDLVRDVHAFSFGRVNPGLVNLYRRWPRVAERMFSLFVNRIGLLQPCDIDSLSSLLVLRMVRSTDAPTSSATRAREADKNIES
jgi:SAM-dependent methyltransferase